MSVARQSEGSQKWHLSPAQEGKPNYIGSAAKADQRDYQVNIDIVSVAYVKRKDAPKDSRCVVLLNVDFVLRRTLLANATVPFSMCDLRTLRMDSNSKHPKFDVRFWYPEIPEVVTTDKYMIHKTTHLTPNISVKAPIASAAISGVGRKSECTRVGTSYIELQGFREPQGENDPAQITWKFINGSSDFFPSSVQLLFTVSSTLTDPTGYFPFDLTIEDRLRVHAEGEDGLLGHLKTIFRPHKPPSGGWVFDIRGNYEEDKAFETFYKVSELDPPIRCIGLEPAAKAYLVKKGT